MTLNETTPLITSSTGAATSSLNGQDDDDQQQQQQQSSSSSNIILIIRYICYGFTFGIIFSGILVSTYIFGYQMSLRNNNHDTTSSTTSLRSNDYDSNPNQQQYDNNDPYSIHISKTTTTTSSSSSSSSSNQYVATQFISFTINTMGGLQEHGECEDRIVDPITGVCYLGNKYNITKDIQHRIQIVQHILQRIKNDAFNESPDIDHIDTVLKIVSLPEFFWRGPYGAYSIHEIHTHYIPFANQLRTMILDDFYNDFIFCFGTIIAQRTTTTTTTTTTSDNNNHNNEETTLHTKDKIEYYNFAPISIGGKRNHHSYIVTKKYISNADFLSRTSTLPNPIEENVRDYSDFDLELQSLFIQHHNTTIVHDNVIVIDNIRIGIEICLDHRLGVLWNNINNAHYRIMEDGLVDVLLITSAGMAIERGPNPIKPGGVVYLCDGSASSAVCVRPYENDNTYDIVFHPNHVCRGDTSISGLKHIPIGTPGYSSFVELTACWDMDEIQHLLKGYYSLYQPQGCAFTFYTYGIDVMDEFKFYPPSIEIYPTIALPTKR